MGMIIMMVTIPSAHKNTPPLPLVLYLRYMYRLDRTAFQIQTYQQADNTRYYWLQKTPAERFRAAWYLICSAYGIDPANPPRLDRQLFSMRKND